MEGFLKASHTHIHTHTYIYIYIYINIDYVIKYAMFS